MSNPPPGWYRNAENQLQWWDGSQWSVKADESGRKSASAEPKSRLWLYLGLPFTLVIIGLFAWLLIFVATLPKDPTSYSIPTPESVDPSQAIEEPVPELEPELTRDEVMVQQGWIVVVSNDTYYRYFTDEERASSSCGYSKCSWVVVASDSGCNGGFYIRADILSNGTPVDWTNTISPSARPGEPVVATLNFASQNGDAIRVSEINCTG